MILNIKTGSHEYSVLADLQIEICRYRNISDNVSQYQNGLVRGRTEVESLLMAALIAY